MDSIFGEVIYKYTRADAIEDGTLVDAGEAAKEIGFVFPVALSRAAWDRAVELPESYKGSQDERGRLWDVLSVLVNAARGYPGNKIIFSVSVLNIETGKNEDVILKSLCHGGDNLEPVLTIMLPGED